MLKYKQFKESIQFRNKNWVDIDLRDIDDVVGDYIWNMYIDTYLPQGMDLSANNWDEMKHKYRATFLIDVDNDQIPDAFLIYRTTNFGNKLALMATNGKKDAKRELIIKILNLLTQEGWYVEASKKMEEILSKTSINIVKNRNNILRIIPKANPIGNGYYTRLLSKVDKVIVKRIYGKPIV
jgi:hypothetical protein